MADPESRPASDSMPAASSSGSEANFPQNSASEAATPEKIASPEHLLLESEQLSEEPEFIEVDENPHIPPPERRLGQHKDSINPPRAHLESMDPVDFQLRKLVGLTIKSGKDSPRFSAEVLDEITDLTRQYMHSFIDTLHRLTEVQRHHIPGLADLDMCLFHHNVTPTELYGEYLRTKDLKQESKATVQKIHSDLENILREYNAEHYNLDKEDPLLVFHANEQYEIAALVPRQNRAREYIPAYFPDLPPDFTYTLTGDYMQTISELKEIKVKLADESRLNEASLYRLIDEDEVRWNKDFERALEDLELSEKEDIMSEIAEETDVETPQEVEKKDADKGGKNNEVPAAAPVSKGFDFVAYAKKRRLAKERYAIEILRRRNLRLQNIFMKAETFFSPSASKVPNKEDQGFFERELSSRFKKVIKATRKAEAAKIASLKSLIERKQQEEKAREQSNGVYEFNFDSKANHLDSDDEEEQPIVFDDEKEKAFEFDFGDEADFENDLGDLEADLANLEGELEGKEEEMEEKEDELEGEVGQVAGKAPLKAPTVDPSQETMALDPPQTEGGMWGLDSDSEELQDLE